jgi:GNAT superfamily N-acetyltransferase
MWHDVGIEKVCENDKEITLGFIDDARKRLRYQTFVAVTDDDVVVGSLGCQVFSGSFPMRSDCKPYGTVWAVYVHPKYRRNGIATALMQHALNYLYSIGCSHAVLIAASAEGHRVYERLGFTAKHCLVRDLSKDQDVPLSMDQLLEKHGVCPSEFGPKALKALETATFRQLLAAFGDDHGRWEGIYSAVKEMQQRSGCYIDPNDNWLTRNVTRFGRGFDAVRLRQDKSELVRKFDRLAPNYDHWTVGNRSKVESFIAHCATTRLLAGSTEEHALANTAARSSTWRPALACKAKCYAYLVSKE